MKTIFSIFCSVLLLTSLLAFIGSDKVLVYAEEPIAEKSELSAAAVAAEPGGIVAASGNNRFVVWYDNTPGNYDILFKRSTDSGATWKTTVNLSANQGHSKVPQLAVQGSNVYVIWCQENSGGTLDDIYLRKSTNNGVSWGPKVKISASGSSNCEWARPQLAASGNHVYATWFDDGSNNAFFRKSSDSAVSFGPIVNLSNSGTVDDDFYNLVALVATGSSVHVAWDDHFGTGDILARSSDDNGDSFTSTIELSNGGGDKLGPELAAAGPSAYAAWSDGDDIYFVRSVDSGTSWGSPFNVSNNPGDAEWPQMALSGNKVYLVWTDDSPGNSEILMRRSMDGGATWKSVKNLSNTGAFSFGPQLTAAGSNVFITWRDDAGGDAEIIFGKSANSGGTIQPLVNISDNTGRSLHPQVITVGTHVYIVWEDRTPGNEDIHYRRSIDTGATWETVQNLSNNSGISIVPRIGN